MISENNLSARLKCIADMVPEGMTLADIGTDHGYIPIVLCAAGKVPKAIAADINPGPLEICREHVRSAELTEKIECRLSDGLDAFVSGEAQCILIAGMGGDLIVDILCRGKDITQKTDALVLSPHTHPEKVREYLYRGGYRITDEDMVRDAGKYYPVIRAVYDGIIRKTDAAECYFGPVLLKQHHPVLKEYLEKEKHKYDEIAAYLKLIEKTEDALNGS